MSAGLANQTQPTLSTMYGLVGWVWLVRLANVLYGQPKIGYNTLQAMHALRLCFCPKMASETVPKHLISNISWGSMLPDPPCLASLCMYTYTANIHVTPLIKILGMGLNLITEIIPMKVYNMTVTAQNV